MAVSDQHPYQYAIMRLVPDVERGEAINIGVDLHCPSQRFLGLRTDVPEQCILALAPDSPIDDIRRHLGGLERIARGDNDAGPMSALTLSERFHWLVSPGSTIVQPGPVHVGLTKDPAASLDRLFARLVSRPTRS